MAWTVSAMGMPGPVRANLAAQFDSAKRSVAGLTTERITIEAVERAVYCELDLLIGRLDPGTAVRVTSAGNGGGSQLTLNIECLPEFLSQGRTEESDEA